MSTTTSNEPTIILITGGNTGLGYQIVCSLLRSSSKIYVILLGGRSLEKATAATTSALEEARSTGSESQIVAQGSKSTVEAIQIDIEDDESVKSCVEVIEKKWGRLDVLVNNAGTQLDQKHDQGQMSLREMYNLTFSTNLTSTHILTHSLVPLLLCSTSLSRRIIFITSGTTSLAGTSNTALRFNQSPAAGWPKQNLGLMAYRSSKTALNMLFKEWQRLLKEDGVKVSCLSPGYLATGLGIGSEANRRNGAGDPRIGADFVRAVVEGERDGEEEGEGVLGREGIQEW